MSKRSTVIALFALFAVVSANAQIKDLVGSVGKKKPSAPAFADASAIQPDAAISNVEGRIKPILERYYPGYKSGGTSSLESDGKLWFMRKDFESARHFYSGGKEGYHSRGVVCELGQAQSDPRYVELKPKMEDAEAKLKEMETAKGYEFVSCEDNTIIFKEIETGRVLSADDSTHV